MRSPVTLQIPDCAREVLERATAGGNEVRLPPERLERPVYEAVNRALETLGGKWNRKAQAHVFPGPVAERLALAVLSGEVLDERKTFQFYPTPRAVAERMVELADLAEWCHVLEPSAGEGDLAHVVHWSGGVPRKQIDLIELHEGRRNRLRAEGGSVVGDDFLTFRSAGPYDRVIANPPFTGGQDVAHASHMLDCVGRGGCVVTVMTPTWEASAYRAARAFREKLNGAFAWETVPLPEGSFAESGTDVRAVLLAARRTY